MQVKTKIIIFCDHPSPLTESILLGTLSCSCIRKLAGRFSKHIRELATVLLQTLCYDLNVSVLCLYMYYFYYSACLVFHQYHSFPDSASSCTPVMSLCFCEI